MASAAFPWSLPSYCFNFHGEEPVDLAVLTLAGLSWISCMVGRKGGDYQKSHLLFSVYPCTGTSHWIEYLHFKMAPLVLCTGSLVDPIAPNRENMLFLL